MFAHAYVLMCHYFLAFLPPSVSPIYPCIICRVGTKKTPKRAKIIHPKNQLVFGSFELSNLEVSFYLPLNLS